MFEIIEELSYDLKKYGTREAGLLFKDSCFALRTCSYLELEIAGVTQGVDKMKLLQCALFACNSNRHHESELYHNGFMVL